MRNVRMVLTLGFLVVILAGFLALPAPGHCKNGYFSFHDNVDAWGITTGRDPQTLQCFCHPNSEYTNYVAKYLNDQIVITVDPDRLLDVAIGLFACVDYPSGTDCRLLAGKDASWFGKEVLSYYVDADNFTLDEFLFGYLIIGVFREFGLGRYTICVDCYWG